MPLLYAPSLPLREWWEIGVWGVLDFRFRASFTLSSLSLDLEIHRKKKNPKNNKNFENISTSVRLALNGRVRPVVRDRVFFSAVMVALGHAGIIMSRDSSMGAGT